MMCSRALQPLGQEEVTAALVSRTLLVSRSERQVEGLVFLLLLGAGGGGGNELSY